MNRCCRNTLLSAAAVLVATPAPAGEWTLQYSTVQSDTAIVTIAAATEDRVIAFGVEPDGQGNSRPVWFRTGDGGKTWKKDLASPGGDLLMLTHLVCPTATRCWAVGIKIAMSSGFGMQNVLMTSLDGGTTWALPPPLAYTESRIAVRDAQNLYLVGGPVVLPIVDSKAGKGFIPKADGEEFKGIADASFVGGSDVFLVNGQVEENQQTGAKTILPNGALLHSSDGGATWTAVFRGHTETVDRVWFFDRNTGFILGHTAQGPFLRRTDDGGQTWFEVLFPVPSKVPAPAFVADAVMFHAGAGVLVASDKDEHDQSFHVVYRMRDGHTLTEEPLPDNSMAMLTVTCASQKVCYLAGEHHQIWRFDGTDPDVVPEEPGTPADPAAGQDLAGRDATASDRTGTDQGPADQAGGAEGPVGPMDPVAGGTGGSGGGGCASPRHPIGTPAVIVGLLAALAVVGTRRRRA